MRAKKSGGKSGLPSSVTKAALVVNIFRHGKAILALGQGRELLKAAGIPLASTSTEIPGAVIAEAGAKDWVKSFLLATAKHRHPERAINPPLV